MANQVLIADRIRELRHLNGLTQEELSELSGIAFPTLRDLEYGVNEDPRLSTVMKLAKAFKMSLDEFVFRKKRP